MKQWKYGEINIFASVIEPQKEEDHNLVNKAARSNIWGYKITWEKE